MMKNLSLLLGYHRHVEKDENKERQADDDEIGRTNEHMHILVNEHKTSEEQLQGGRNEHDDYDENEEEEEEEEEETYFFPTHPGFTIPVEIRPTPHLGPGQYGVFAAADIPKHTNFWVWTDRVIPIPSHQMANYIAKTFPNVKNNNANPNTNTLNNNTLNNNGTNDPIEDDDDQLEEIRTFLRRGFVLPSPYDDVFYSNPTDGGAFMNHSSLSPNCARPHGTTRFIVKGEELTMDYSGNGNPLWYQDLCHQYGILTAVEIAEKENECGGFIQPADYTESPQFSLLEQLFPF